MQDLQSIFEQRRVNKTAQAITIPEAFRQRFPNMKAEKAEKLFRKYLDVMLGTLLNRLPFLHDGETYVSLDTLMTKCGEFQYEKKRHWLWNELKNLYPFVQVVAKGSNLRAAQNPFEKNSRVKVVNERLLAMLLDQQAAESVFWQFYVEHDMSEAGQVPIDMDNLHRFVGCCELELESATGTAHRAKLQRNLWQARLVLKIGEFTEASVGTALLPLVAAPSPFGRTYYKGLNIQNVSKQVRSAILGHHFQYDMNAAVFAVKLYLYGVISGGDGELAGTPNGMHTRQYLAEKKLIREKLARSCFQGIDVPSDTALTAVKNALTAIGFGAKTSGKVWMGEAGLQGTALSDILISPLARERFLSDRWVRAFLDEQRIIEDAILAAADASEGADAMNKAAAASNGINGRSTKAGKMAYVYQNEETNLMDVAVAVLAQFGIFPLARIHDAFIVRERLPSKILDEIHVAWGLRSYLSLDCEEVKEWSDASFKRALSGEKARIAAHRQAIEFEERKAIRLSARTNDIQHSSER